MAITATMCLDAGGRGMPGDCAIHSRADAGPVVANATSSETPWLLTTDRIYRQRLTAALGDRVDYYWELLDVHHFPDPAYESDFEDYLVRKYHNRPIDVLLATWPDRDRFGGAPAGAARVAPSHRVH